MFKSPCTFSAMSYWVDDTQGGHRETMTLRQEFPGDSCAFQALGKFAYLLSHKSVGEGAVSVLSTA